MAMKALILALGLSTLASAIYPDDHWEYSKELTTDNFEEYVQSEIDSGRTLFAPAWNQVVKDFASNPDVSFGDINLSEQSIRGAPYNPGSGGWPTIRYFNKETGPDGAPYEKKTDKAMCDELGPKENYMALYVEEAGKTSSCSINGENAGCNEKQVNYINKMKAKTFEEQEKQFNRLTKMNDNDMTPELRDWKNQRIKILKQFIDNNNQDAEKEEL